MSKNNEAMKTLYEIKERVIRIEEHLKTLNSRTQKNEEKLCRHDNIIDKINNELAKVTVWDKIKTVALVTVFGIASSLATYLITHAR